MPYCTLDDIKKMIPEESIIELTDDEGTDVVNTDRVDEAIAQADSEIDAYCGTKYSVPFATVPDTIKKISVDIAIYNLYSRKLEKIPETRTERYKNAIRFLEGIPKGTTSIGKDPEPDAPTEGGPEATTSKDDRIFNKEKLENY